MNKTVRVQRFFRWSIALIWLALIYLTLPYARVWTDWLTEKLTGYFIPITVLVIFIGILIYTIVRMIRRKSLLPDYVLFILVLAGYVFALVQIEILIEQVHFLEYGLLAVLFLRALGVDKIGTTHYLNALLLIALAGVIDEFIQGILVNRVGELHDVYLNVLAGGLALIWHRYCIRPFGESAADWRKALKYAIPVASATILIIGVFNSHITDFGHYIEDDEIGAFYSRMHPNELLNNPPEVEYFKKEILPLLYKEDYSTLLKLVDNTIHGEVLVHIFRRDRRLKRDNDYVVAHRENQILDRYFVKYIENSQYKWSDEQIGKIYRAAGVELNEYYVSPVSQNIITSFSEKTQWIFVIVMQSLLIVFFIYLFLPAKRNNNSP